VPSLPSQVGKAQDTRGHLDEIGLEADQEDVTDLGHVIVDHQEEDQDRAVDQEIVEDDQEAVTTDEDLEADQEVDLKKDRELDRLPSGEKRVEADPDDEATDLDQTVDAHDLRKNYCTRTI